MKESNPKHIVVSVSAARRNMRRLLDEVSSGQHVFVITRRGMAKAVLLGVNDYNSLVSGVGLPPVETKRSNT